MESDFWNFHTILFQCPLFSKGYETQINRRMWSTTKKQQYQQCNHWKLLLKGSPDVDFLRHNLKAATKNMLKEIKKKSCPVKLKKNK